MNDELFPVTITTPVEGIMAGFLAIRMFLEILFFSSVFLLCLLGCLVIYSLLVSDIDSKTYEYAMLRALGLRRHSLFILLSLQAFLFSIPATIAGLIWAAVPHVYVVDFMETMSATNIDEGLRLEAVLLAVALGFAIPQISNALSVRRAFSNTLCESLDVYHDSATEVTVTKIEARKVGISPEQMATSIILSVCGILTYYVVPLTFIYGEIGMFLHIMNGILLGMLLGLSFVAQTIIPFLSRTFTKAMAFVIWSKRWVQIAVRKNLSSHSTANRKTSILLLIASAFLLFAGAMFALIANMIRVNLEVATGADFIVINPSQRINLPLNEIQRVLNEAQGNGLCSGFTATTFPLSSSTSISSTKGGNIAGYPMTTVNIFGVESNYMDVVFKKYTAVRSMAEEMSGVQDVIKGLYANASSTNFMQDRLNSTVQQFGGIYSLSLNDESGLNLTEPLMLQMGTRNAGTDAGTVVYFMRPLAILSKLSGFNFASFKTAARNSPVLISMDGFASLWNSSGAVWNASSSKQSLNSGSQSLDNQTELRSISCYKNDCPIQRVLVRMPTIRTKEQRMLLLNNIRSVIDDDRIQVLDMITTIESTGLANMYLQIFLNVVGVIALLLTLFITYTTSRSNIEQNSREVGVLRSLGATLSQMKVVYILEAMVLLFSSFAMGLVIGVGIASTLTLQFNLFLETPFVLYFPYALFFSMCSLCIVAGVGGSFFPISDLLRNPLSSILHGQT